MNVWRGCLTLVSCLVGVSCDSARSQTLGVALDNTNLVWTTSPSNSTSRPWTVTTDYSTTYDGVDAAASGNRFVANSQSWVQTSVAGPGTLSFWWSISSVWPDSLEFRVDDVLQDSIFDAVDWNYRQYAIPAGAHTVKWAYVKDGSINDGIDQGFVDQVAYSTSPPPPLSVTLNTCGAVWTSGGNTNPTYWTGQTNVSSDGKAAESGAVYSTQESWLRVVVSGVSNVSFLWRVSSETNLDWLEFYTNSYVHDPFNPPSNYAVRVSGEVTTWRSNFFRLAPAATNTLTWRYVKNDFDFFAKGQDRGWVDRVSLGGLSGAFAFAIAEPVRLPDGRFQLSLVGESGCPCRVQFSTNIATTNWTTFTNLTTFAEMSPVIDLGATGSVTRFYRAVSP